MNDEINNAPAGAAESATPTAATPAPSAPVSGSPPDAGTPEGVGSDAAPAQGTPTDEPPKPVYDLEQHAHLIGNRGEGYEHFHGFADAMAEARVPEAVVRSTLTFYEGMVTGRATWDGLVDAHDGSPESMAPAIQWFAEKTARSDAAPSAQEIADARAYVRHLPAEIREALEVVPRRGGRAPGNDPRVIRMFALAATGATPPRAKEAAPMTNGSDAEREEIETAMRERRHEYNRDPGMQQRYREIVTGTAQARPANSPDAELASIEKVMRTDRRKYNRDERMQARYRELLAARGR